MFLTRIARLARTARSVGTDDRGVALAAVLVFMAAGILLSSVVASTVVQGLQFSASTRAGVQSQSSAEAGIAVARAVLMNGQCVSPGTQTSAGALDNPATANVDESAPAYSAQIQYSTDGGTTWVDGCPASVQQAARIVSTGTALIPGQSSDPTGDTTKVEARLSTIQNQATLNPSGPAVYSYNTSGFGGSGKLVSSGGYATSVMIRNGNVTCDGAANGAADLVVKSGTFNATGSCVVTGNVWVNGAATISGGAKLGGSLTATSVDSSGEVGGNVWSDSTLKLSWGGKVTGWASGASLEIAGGQVNQSAWARTGISIGSGGGVTGTLWSQGNVTVSNATIGTVVTQGTAALSGGSITTLTSEGAVTVSGGSAGTVVSRGAATLSGTISTSLKAASLTMSNGSLGGGAISGAACFTNGSVNGALKVGSITGTGGCYTQSGQSWWGGWSKISVGASTLPASTALAASPSKPSAAIVPDWVDFGSDPKDYTTGRWPGYTVVTMGTDCSDVKVFQALQAVGTNPGLIDARTCSNGFAFSGGSGEQTGQGQNANGFRLKNNLAIIANRFDISGSANFFSNSGSSVNLWLINPDTIANNSPDCGGRSLSVGGGFYATNVNIMFYTPCTMTLASSTTVKGQIFAGSNVTFGGAGLLDYIPLGLPGYNLDTGAASGATYTEADRTLQWQRNVTAG
jgi:hypothetical protein